jgi:RNA polymerase sigma factor (TIGR02999 family)
MVIWWYRVCASLSLSYKHASSSGVSWQNARMPDELPNEPLTIALRAAHAGDREAANRVYVALYPELLKIARARLRTHQANTLLDTEALVHETFMRFVSADKLAIDDRRHFFTYAAKVMRNIVIDFARRKQAARRGGANVRVTLKTNLLGNEQSETSVVDVDGALQELEARDPVLAQVVEMRYYGGYSDMQIATALDITDRTVRRYWDKARAFILVQLQS